MSKLSRFASTWQNSFKAPSLKQQIVMSSVLSAAAFFLTSAFRLVSTVIITRLLAPDVFGIFAVLSVFTFILAMFSDFGIRSLILTREEAIDDAFLHACWTVQAIRGAVLAVAILLVSFALAAIQALAILPAESSFAAPVLPWAVAAMSLSFLIQSLEVPNSYVYERDMKFGTVTLAEIIFSFVSLLIVIVLAWYLRSIWSLVVATICGAITQVFLSRTMFRGPAMRLSFDRSLISLIFKRGRWIVSHSALTAITSVADRVIFGIYMPATDFGFYYIAKQLVDMPASLLNVIHAKVGLQVFTELHKGDDREAFLSRYYGYRRFFDLLAMFGCGALLALAPLIVEVLYDDRYADVAQMVKILALGLPLTGFVILREAFSAQRRFRIMAMLSVMQTVSIWIGLLLAILVFDSIPLAIGVVALHRLPEVIALIWLGYGEGWILFWREIRFLPVIIVGFGFGYIVARILGTLLL